MVRSVDERYLCTRLFSQNEQDFTNRDFLEIQSDILNRFNKYPCSFERFLNDLQKSASQVKSRVEIGK